MIPFSDGLIFVTLGKCTGDPFAASKQNQYLRYQTTHEKHLTILI